MNKLVVVLSFFIDFLKYKSKMFLWYYYYWFIYSYENYDNVYLFKHFTVWVGDKNKCVHWSKSLKNNHIFFLFLSHEFDRVLIFNLYGVNKNMRYFYVTYEGTKKIKY